MAVYTLISDHALENFLVDYDVGALLSFKGIAEGVENSNYIVRTTQGVYILTLYEKRVNTADLPFFMALMAHLSAKGLPAPLPIAMRSGRVLNTLEGKSAVLISFLDGVSPTCPSVAQCAAIGKTLGQMHLAVRDFDLNRKNSMDLSDWRVLISDMRTHTPDAPYLDLLIDEQDFLDRMWPDLLSHHDLPMGVIHADLFPNNSLFLGDVLSGVIDFYFACSDVLVYDLAIVLNAWCFDDMQVFMPDKAHALIGAYEAVRPLQHFEKQHFSLMCRRAAQRFLVSRAYDFVHTPKDALVTPLDPAAYATILTFHKANPKMMF